MIRPKVLFLTIAVLILVTGSGMAADNPGRGHLELTPDEQVWLSAHPVIRVGIMPEWPPLNFVDRFGAPSGIGVDYLELLNRRLGGILTIVPKPFHEAMAAVKSGTLDAMMDITPKKEREAWFHFTRPYLIIPHVIVARKDGPYYRTEKDLSGRSVALEKGFYNVRYFREHYPEVRVIEYPSTSLALGAVSRGEADAYAGNRAVATYLIERELMTNIQVQGRLDKSPVVLSMGVRKDWPVLAAILNKAFHSLTVSEERGIRKKWFEETAATVAPNAQPVPVEFHGIVFVLKSVLAVFVLILAAALGVWVAQGRPRTLSLRGVHFGISLVFTGMIVAICTFVLLLQQMEKKRSTIEKQKYESLRLAYELKQSVDDLTRFARTFSVTGEFRFEAYYKDIIAIRDGIKPHPGNRVPSYWDHVAAGTMNLDETGEIYSIGEKMAELGLSAAEKEKLVQAKKASDDLVVVEAAAMNAVKGIFKDKKGAYTIVGEPDRRMARQLLNGKAYHIAKSEIMKSIDDFYTLLEGRSGNEIILIQRKTEAVLTAVTILTLLTIVFAVFSFFVMKKRIIAPLYRLKSGATRLKEGDYSHHIEIGSDDEVGELARTFNAMADSIKERTARLRSIIDTAIDAIIVISGEGRIREFSPAAEKMFGYEAGEVKGNNIAMLMPEPDKGRHDDYLLHYMRSGRSGILGKRFETLGLRKDGQTVSISISISEARVGGERLFTGIIRDITERKLIEEARQSSLKMNQMTDTASEKEILDFGLEACVSLTRSRTGFFHFLGQDLNTVEEQLWSGKVLKDCEIRALSAHHNVDRAGIWADCLRKKAPVILNSYEEAPQKKGLPGGHLPLERVLTIPVMDGRNVVAVLGVGNKSEPYGQYDLDIVTMLCTNLWGIVRRLRWAKQMRENEERLNLVLKGGNLGYWDVNLKTRETFVNRRWAQLFGYEMEEIGDPYEAWKSGIHPDDREKVFTLGREYRAGLARSYEIEYRAVTRDGETRWHISRGGVMARDHAGNPLRMAGTVLDITEKKVIEEELRQNMEDLKRFSDIAIGREEKMIALKEEINALVVEKGKDPKYKIVE